MRMFKLWHAHELSELAAAFFGAAVAKHCEIKSTYH